MPGRIAQQRTKSSKAAVEVSKINFDHSSLGASLRRMQAILDK